MHGDHSSCINPSGYAREFEPRWHAQDHGLPFHIPVPPSLLILPRECEGSDKHTANPHLNWPQRNQLR